MALQEKQNKIISLAMNIIFHVSNFSYFVEDKLNNWTNEISAPTFQFNLSALLPITPNKGISIEKAGENDIWWEYFMINRTKYEVIALFIKTEEC